MTLTGEKFQKFVEQVQLGRDILSGADFSKIIEKLKSDRYENHLYSDNHDGVLPVNEENMRLVAAEALDREISTLKEGENLSRKSGYGTNNFFVTIRCSNREKSISLVWRRWHRDEPLFSQTFEIVI